MGREAQVHAEVGAEVAEVKALLESGELILRGALRRRFARAAITDARAEGEVLRFACDGETVRLHLGARAAVAWAKAVATPPPDLRHKLGLKPGVKALFLGVCDDAALTEALAEALTDDAAAAAMLIARIDGPADVAAAQALGAHLPIWAVYRKGKTAFGDAAIRSALRAVGCRDTKSCAVSDRLTATRYDPG